MVSEEEEESHLQAEDADGSDNPGGVATLKDTTTGPFIITASPSMPEDQARELGLAIKYMPSLPTTWQIRIVPEEGFTRLNSS